MTDTTDLARKLRVMAAIVTPDTPITLHLDRAGALSLVHLIEREGKVIQGAADLDRIRGVWAGVIDRAQQDADRHALRVLNVTINAWLVTILLQEWLSRWVS